MDSKKHPLSKALHKGMHPGQPSVNKEAAPAGTPMMQPDQGDRMDPGMNNSPGM